MKYNYGFTIIELIIVAMFIILFTSFSLASYNQYTQDKKLSATSKKISSLLDLARSKTVAGDTSLCGYNPKTSAKVISYSVIVSNDAFAIKPDCLVGTPTPIVYKTADNITFPTPTLSISFQPISGNTQCSYIPIKNSVLFGGSCRYVKITETGLTSEDACTSCDTCPAPSPGVNLCP